MKKSLCFLVIVILLGSFFGSNLNADVLVLNNTGDKLSFGLLWSSITSNTAKINSRQWIGLSTGEVLRWHTEKPPVFTECYWLAIKNHGISLFNVKNDSGKVYYYTTDVVLPSAHNHEIKLNDFELAGMRGIGSTCFCGGWEKFVKRLSRSGYNINYYKGWKIWTTLNRTHDKDIKLEIIKRNDGKYDLRFKFQ